MVFYVRFFFLLTWWKQRSCVSTDRWAASRAEHRMGHPAGARGNWQLSALLQDGEMKGWLDWPMWERSVRLSDEAGLISLLAKRAFYCCFKLFN